MSNTNGGGEQLDKVIAGYLKRVDRGEQVDRQRFIQSHFSWEKELQDFFTDLDFLQHHVDAFELSDPDTSELTRTSVGGGVSNSYIQLSAPHAGASEGGKPLYFGDYVLLQELGRGGMGIVFKARQRSLDRIVCVKMMLMAELAEVEEFKRFRAEALAIAGLRHPGIVAIYEVGQHNGSPYYTMEYVDGASLSQSVSEALLPVQKAADYVHQIAVAVHVAHEKGIIHRDLKPSNVLVDDQQRVHITDFGVAKYLEADEDLTVTGQVLGTPSYMSPEQATARRGEVGRGADIYALGAILYALLIGRPPHCADGALETMRQVIHEPPISPRVLNAGVPVDLETICMKCLEKSPAARYPTANELAADLQRYLSGEPIRARRTSLVGRVTRWLRRHPTASLSLTSLVLLTLGATIGLTLHGKRLAGVNTRLQESVTDLDAALAEAQRNELTARSLQYVSDMQLVEPYAAEGDYRSSQELLENNIPPADKLDLRGFEWHVLRQRQWRTGQTLAKVADPLYCVEFSPDGAWIATGGKDAIIRLYAVKEGPNAVPLEIPTDHGEVNDVAFSAGGDRLASGGDDGRVCVWDLRTQRLLLTFAAHAEITFNVTFLRNDSALLTCGTDNTLQLWDAASGAHRGRLEGPAGVCDALAVTSDGRHAWAVMSDRSCQRFDLHALKNVGPRITHFDRPTCVAVTPDDRLVVSGDLGSQLIACNVATGKTETIEAFHPIQSVVISSDGRHLATGDRNGSIRIWEIRVATDANTGYTFEAQAGWHAHEGRVYGLTFSHDGSELVSVGSEGGTRVWNVQGRIARAQPFEWAAGNQESDHSFQFLPHSNTIISANPDVGIEMWDCREPGNHPTATIPFQQAQCVGCSRDGTLIAAGTDQGRVVVWNGQADNAPVYHWNVEQSVYQIAFSPRNDFVAVVLQQPDSAFRQTQLYRLSDGSPVFTTPKSNWREVAFSNTEPILYVALDLSDCIIEWQLDTETARGHINEHDTTIRHIAVSPCGTYIVSVANDRTVLVHNTKDRTESPISTGLLGQAEALLMGPRSTSVIIADAFGVFRVCNLRAHKRVMDIVRIFEPGQFNGAALSSDARYLVLRRHGAFHLFDLLPLGVPPELNVPPY